jgi:hypothetical protein
MNIGKTLIPCAGILGISHTRDINDHPVYELCLSIYLGVDGSIFHELGVQE